MTSALELDLNLDQLDHPFTITSNPRYFYVAPQYKVVLQNVIRGIIKRQGLSIVEGPIGCGKSTMFRYLLDWLAENIAEQSNIAYLSNPNYSTALQLLRAICENLGLPTANNKLDQSKILKQFLYEQGEKDRFTVLLIDEAHRLNGEMLELIRELFNFAKNDAFLIQIVLVAEDKPLHYRLAKKPAIKSRATHYMALVPLSLEEASEVIRLRLRIAEISEDLFTPEATKEIWKASKGIPRDIVNIGYRVFNTFSELPESVTATMVKNVLAMDVSTANA